MPPRYLLATVLSACATRAGSEGNAKVGGDVSTAPAGACTTLRPEVLDQLRKFSRGDAATLLEALVRHDDAPWLLDQLPHGRRWSPRDITCLSQRLAGVIAWRRFAATAVLVTGKPRSESLLRWQLPKFCEAADLVVLVSWTGTVSHDHWLRRWSAESVGMCHAQLLEVDRSSVEIEDVGLTPAFIDQIRSRLNSEEPQDIELRVGLRAIAQHFDTTMRMAVSSADILVVKTRTDVYFPTTLLNQVMKLNYSLPVKYTLSPFLYQVWVPWVDAIQPFYFADDTFAGALFDMWQLCWQHAAMYPTSNTLGVAVTHVNRWVLPFLPWYPLLGDFWRNKLDVSNRLLHSREGTGTSRIVELAAQGGLRNDVDAYLTNLLALYYNILITFFSVGASADSTGGVHLVLRTNATVHETDGQVHLNASEVRCRPGSWGFVPGPLDSLAGGEQSMRDDAFFDCAGAPADVSAGLVHMNAVSKHWAKPVSSTHWIQRMAAGATSVKDGLTERVADAMKHKPLEPYYFASTEHNYDEELQTGWCQDVAMEFQHHYSGSTDVGYLYSKGFRSWNPEDVSSTDWWSCCNPEYSPTSPCFTHVHLLPPEWQKLSMGVEPEALSHEGLTNMCCFPVREHCPRWLSEASFRGMVLTGLARGHLGATSLIEDDLTLPAIFLALPLFCGGTRRARERKAEWYCKHGATFTHFYESISPLCRLRNLSRSILPRLAPRRRANQRHFFQPRPKQRHIRVLADTFTALA